MKKIFLEGAIPSEFIADSIAKHQSKHSIGAHNIFLGQVRADEVDGKKVSAIEFTAYEEMALEKAHEIREAAFEKFDLTCLHIYHSLGNVAVGGVCIFVFVSAPRRKQVYEATEWLVNQVKTEVPIFGKEIFENEESQWKVNS
ncbi:MULTISPECIES: molybdenum cofactor biosynthesis protein MoaE [Algoriphagus]|jgi:molybdopterin synthase catalytic subunit|uniref:Molybdopterin synthase catalytic subunit n=1 Tax=Algoriphagus zhangzhouensis TaxID=1073327 RepID=A0A1M7ZAD7_9BACT|nr:MULTISPECIES: molybdenum cofactor biosynthesis protein MoaE [Algoriphagus]TDY47196.1 molybdopterin synthase catalytic subunit [Algoriphagus zhangzhouensis]SHO61844.1 molybdopterin synthase catalytic subunit [Algoriphagus zhangzhouensis]